jgi:hypothetical protein
MHKRRFDGEIERLRAPQRLTLLEIDLLINQVIP